MKNISLPLLAVAAALAAPAAAQYAPAPPSDADRLAAEMRVIGQNPTDVVALTEAGELSTRIGDLSGAASLFARADKVDPRNGRVKAGMADVLLHLERPGEALQFYNQAEGYGYPVARFAAERGLAYDLVAQQGRAQRDYRLALASGAGGDETVRRYALSLGISGQKEAALQQLEPLLRRNDRGAWRARAFVLAMNGDSAGAQKIAATMMAPGQAGGMAAFFARLPALGPADRAFAVQFGEVRPTPQRLADLRLAPALPALPPEVIAVARPAPPPVQVAATRVDKRKRPRKGEVQLAAVVPAPVAPVLPSPPAYGALSRPVAAASSSTSPGVGPRAVVPGSAAFTRVLPARSPLPAPPLAPRTAPASTQAPVAIASATPAPRRSGHYVTYQRADSLIPGRIWVPDPPARSPAPAQLAQGAVTLPAPIAQAAAQAGGTTVGTAQPGRTGTMSAQTAPVAAAPLVPVTRVPVAGASAPAIRTSPPALPSAPVALVAAPVTTPQAARVTAAVPGVSSASPTPVATSTFGSSQAALPSPAPAGVAVASAVPAFVTHAAGAGAPAPSAAATVAAAAFGRTGPSAPVVAPGPASRSAPVSDPPRGASAPALAALEGGPASPGSAQASATAQAPAAPAPTQLAATRTPSPPVPTSLPGFSAASVGGAPSEPVADGEPAGITVASAAPAHVDGLAGIVSALPVPASELDVAAPTPKPAVPVRHQLAGLGTDIPSHAAPSGTAGDARESDTTDQLRPASAKRHGPTSAAGTYPSAHDRQPASADAPAAKAVGRKGASDAESARSRKAASDGPATAKGRHAALAKADVDDTAPAHAKRRRSGASDDDAPVTARGHQATLARADAEDSAPAHGRHGRKDLSDDDAPTTIKGRRAALARAGADDDTPRHGKRGHHDTDEDDSTAEKPTGKHALAAKHEAEPQRYWVQVAGGANEASLGKAWSVAQSKAPALAGRKGYTTPLHATNRVLAGPFKTDEEARAFVNTLNKQGVHAFQFTNDKGQKVRKLDDE